MKYTCEYCGKYIKNGHISHYESCKRITENKELIEKDYLEYKSIAKLEKIWHIDHNKLSEYLKLWGYEIEKTQDIYKNYKRKYEVDDNFLTRNLYAPQYWFIGLMASDGNVTNNQILLSQSGEDGKKLIQFVNNLLKSNYKIREEETSFKKAYQIQITSRKIVRRLEKFNVVPNKTLIYKYPKNIPEKYISCFFGGIC